MRTVGRLLLVAFSARFIPLQESLFRKSPKLLPMWIPVAEKRQIKPGKLLEVTLSGEPIVLYLDESKSMIEAIYGICPHQGVHFKTGHVDRTTGCVSCPYHGFQFKEGMGYRLPTKEKIAVPRLQVMTDKDWVYVMPSFNEIVATPYQPPEEVDTSFVPISGSVIINRNCDLITENVLDMLHVSYIHYFGNQDYPLPYNIQFEQLSNISGRTSYKYRSGSKSISKVVGRAQELVVENEFHLPSTTITRVKVKDGELIKTVLTRAMPINEEQSILFWKIYRNFWCGNMLEHWIGDTIMRIAMRQTLAEDIGILREIHTKSRLHGFTTIYDTTINEFRKAKKMFE